MLLKLIVKKKSAIGNNNKQDGGYINAARCSINLLAI
jgi:hypothetical protein